MCVCDGSILIFARYLKTMKKSDGELSMVTGKVLQQQRLNTKSFEQSERLSTVPAFGDKVMYCRVLIGEDTIVWPPHTSFRS